VGLGAPESAVRRPEDGASRHATAFTEPEKLPDWFLPCIRKAFAGQGDGQVVKWLELAASKGKITEQPLFEFKADQVVKGRVVLIGDCAHMASPRTAAGAHTGILDAAGLQEAFSRYQGKNNIDAAINAYESGGKRRAADLYARSKQVSAPLIYRPGDDIDKWRNSKEL
jgi:2-polyprenyl-6-methoxyphenol hydroxylase-like FAD-dependent oxidoreductase